MGTTSNFCAYGYPGSSNTVAVKLVGSLTIGPEGRYGNKLERVVLNTNFESKPTIFSIPTEIFVFICYSSDLYDN